jgi:hypothetical protein
MVGNIIASVTLSDKEEHKNGHQIALAQSGEIPTA